MGHSIAQADTRNHGIDCLRVLAMLMIIILHIMGHGGLLEHCANGTPTHYVAYYLEAISYCAVDCFALLSGYVMCTSHFNAKRLTELWFLVFFWSVAISMVGFIAYPETLSTGNIIKPLFPILTGRYWFFNSYFVMVLFSPILNLIIQSSSKQLYQKILLACFVVFCLIPLFPLGEDVFSLGRGYEFPWFLALYLLGGYLRRFDLEIKWQKSRVYFLAVIILPLVNTAYYFLSMRLTEIIFHEVRYTDLLLSYISPTVVAEALALFALFKNLNLKSIATKMVSFVQPSIFSVYLIHDHPFIRGHFIYNAFIPLASSHPVTCVIFVAGSVLCIFAICIMIDRVRIFIFRWLRIDRLTGRLGEGLIQYIDRLLCAIDAL